MLAELLTLLKLCLPDVLVWIQTFSKGHHPTVGLRSLHTLELMPAGVERVERASPRLSELEVDHALCVSTRLRWN